MKAKQVEVTTDDFMEMVNKLNRSRFTDTDEMQVIKGESGSPHKNQIRPVGNFESVRRHYLPRIVEDPNEHGLPFYLVCIGRSDCPLCKISDELSNAGTEQLKEAAKDYYSSERNFWNAIPRWDYNYGDEGERLLVVQFGSTARKTLEEIVTTNGHPGSPSSGFDLFYVIEDRTGIGADYKFLPVTERVQSETSISHEIRITRLKEKEGDFDMVDLSKYTESPSAEVLEAVQRECDIENILGDTPKKGRGADFTEEDAGNSQDNDAKEESVPEQAQTKEEESEKEEQDDSDPGAKPLCFAEEDIYDTEDEDCIKCPFFKPCGREIRMNSLAEARGKRKNGKK